jgi:DnaJ-class molecular chaperone
MLTKKGSCNTDKTSECPECRGNGFWWIQTCELELNAKFSTPKKIICPKCKGSGFVSELEEEDAKNANSQ